MAKEWRVQKMEIKTKPENPKNKEPENVNTKFSECVMSSNLMGVS